MAVKTKIAWTDSSWNPWHGCRKVSAGCKHCYMYRDKDRFGQDPTTVLRSKTTFRDPLKWKEGRKIFACSWSDFFIEEADAWRDEAWDIIRSTPHHTYQILTKRPERIRDHLPADWGEGYPNVWMGTSVENQEAADKRIPVLVRVSAVVRFLSCEPLLGGVDLRFHLGPDFDPAMAKPGARCGHHGNLLFGKPCPICFDHLDWVIVGGESGPDARPMHPDWARSIRDQCQATRTPFFFKQWGSWEPFYDRDRDDPDWRQVPEKGPDQRVVNLQGGHGFHGEHVVHMHRIDHRQDADALLDGRTWTEFPTTKER